MRTLTGTFVVPGSVAASPPLNVAGWDGLTVQIDGTFDATMQIEGSIDGTNYVDISGDITAGSITDITKLLKLIRINVSIWASGTPDAVVMGADLKTQ